MKNITRYIGGSLAAAVLMFASCTQMDYPNRFVQTDGVPTVDYVRYADRDVFISQAYMDEVLCLVGGNLCSIHNIYFNDQEAVLNTSYITDKTLIVQVPSSPAVNQTNKIYLVTAAKDTVTVDFKVLPPAPKISSMSNEWASAGEEVTLTGRYFIDVKSLSFPGAAVTDYTVVSPTTITLKVPAGAVKGPVEIVTESGSGRSTFQYLDDRNILFDFDGSRGGFATGNGWRAPASGHIHAPGDDAFAAIDGNYIWLGGQAGGLKEDPTAQWAEDPYSFNYWNDDAGTGIPPLKTLPTFAGYLDKYGIGGLALKFECIVPSSNPWKTCSMQLCFTSSAAVHNTNMNNLFYTDDACPRALWTPWKGAGSYDTADKWVTISIPLTDFIYTPTGGACSTTFDKSWLDGFSFFVWSGYGGSDCDPVIAMDNIRVVPL